MNNFAAKLAQAVGLTPPQNSAAPAPPAARRAAPAAAEPVPIRAVGPLSAGARASGPQGTIETFPHQPPPVTAAVIRAACQGQAETDSELAAVKAEFVPWMNLSNELANQLARTPQQRRLAHNAEFAARIARGDTAACEMDQWSAEDWLEDQREKVSALKTQMRKHELAAWDICKPIFRRLADAVEKYAVTVQEAEAREYAKYSLEYRPSYLVLAMHKVAHDLRHVDRSGAGSPMAMLPTFTGTTPTA